MLVAGVPYFYLYRVKAGAVYFPMTTVTVKGIRLRMEASITSLETEAA